MGATNTQPTTHQFFYFYHAGIIVVEVLGVAISILQQWNPRIAIQQPWLMVPEFAIGVFSFVMFVCTIVAFVIWRKRRYPSYTYLTPAIYLGLAILLTVFGAVWSVQQMASVMQSTGENTDPMLIQQQMMQQTIPAWLYISSYARAAITLAVAIGVLLKFKRQTTQ